jgi:hypothetical protein
VINKKATEFVFRGLGVFTFYLLNKKLIESPLSHGDALPCCLATSFKENHSRGEHNVNIVELYFSVKIFVCTFIDEKNPLTCGWPPTFTYKLARRLMHRICRILVKTCSC